MKDNLDLKDDEDDDDDDNLNIDSSKYLSIIYVYI